jgi:hypothetical protein
MKSEVKGTATSKRLGDTAVGGNAPYLRRLFIDYPPLRIGFAPIAVRMGFVANRVRQG